MGPGGGMPRRPVSMSTGNLADLYESAAAERGGGGGGMAGLRGVASSSNLWDQQASRLSLRCVWRWGHGPRDLEAATACVCARRTRAGSCHVAQVFLHIYFAMSCFMKMRQSPLVQTAPGRGAAHDTVCASGSHGCHCACIV